MNKVPRAGRVIKFKRALSSRPIQNRSLRPFSAFFSHLPAARFSVLLRAAHQKTRMPHHQVNKPATHGYLLSLIAVSSHRPSHIPRRTPQKNAEQSLGASAPARLFYPRAQPTSYLQPCILSRYLEQTSQFG